MPRAAVCNAIDTPLEVVDVELQPPKANEVKVRLGASGVCHSDLSVRNGTLLAPLPAVLRDGQPLLQMSASGTFTESTVVPAISAVKIDKDIPLTAAALIGCGVLTGFGAAHNTADIRQGDTVAVVGCGGVGLNVIQGAKHAGAERIIAIHMVDGKLQTAGKFGATDLVNARDEDSIAKVMELTGQRGADVAFEVIGLQATIDQAFTMTRRGGQTVLVGVPAMDVMMTVPVGLGLIFSEKQIRGCLYGSSNVHHDIPMLANLYNDGKLMLDELVSHEITLDDVNTAMDEMSSGEVARSVIVFN